jgi:cardiolipin synthase
MIIATKDKGYIFVKGERLRVRLKKGTKIFLILLGLAFLLVVVFYDFASDKALEKEIICNYGVNDAEFVRVMNNILGPAIMEGGKTETLLNGDEVFPAMLQAIQEAKKTITFETYIYWSGKVGREFTDALTKKAKEGVKVHVLLDWVGSGKMQKELLEEMEASGVQVGRYHEVSWYSIQKLNNRTHRKIMIVDGKVGFTGGLGVADHWLGNAESKGRWRDTHYRFEGPSVSQMQSVFNENWIELRGELLHGPDYFPPPEIAGNQKTQVFKSSPEDGSESARLMYLLSIAAARKNIYMSNAYFVPDDLSVKHLVSAAKRGVKIQIIAPGEITDTKLVRSASRSRWGELLKAGVEFYEYQPTMFHCKVMTVDDIWSSVGSTNFDNRSFRLNDEVNLNIYDADFAREQNEIFKDDLSKSRKITYEDWQNRPVTEKFKEWLAGLLRHQL